MNLLAQRKLPRNITARPDGYVVRVNRSGITYQAFTTDFVKAVALRDRFIAIHGAIKAKGPHKTAYSNTGVVGVSETVAWHHSRPYPCFIASWSVSGRNRTKRFYYGDQRPRAAALQQAIALRSKMVGLSSSSAAAQLSTQN